MNEDILLLKLSITYFSILCHLYIYHLKTHSAYFSLLLFFSVLIVGLPFLKPPLLNSSCGTALLRKLKVYCIVINTAVIVVLKKIWDFLVIAALGDELPSS